MFWPVYISRPGLFVPCTLCLSRVFQNVFSLYNVGKLLRKLVYTFLYEIPFVCIIFVYPLYSFFVTEVAVLTGTGPFCSPPLDCALLNPFLVFKLSACNELNSFWLLLIRIFMCRAGRSPQKHISVSFKSKHLRRGILLTGGTWKCFDPLGPPGLAASRHSPSPECRMPGTECLVLNPQNYVHSCFIHCLDLSLAVL